MYYVVSLLLLLPVAGFFTALVYHSTHHIIHVHSSFLPCHWKHNTINYVRLFVHFTSVFILYRTPVKSTQQTKVTFYNLIYYTVHNNFINKLPPHHMNITPQLYIMYLYHGNLTFALFPFVLLCTQYYGMVWFCMYWYRYRQSWAGYSGRFYSVER